ncbi:MAG: carbohydrate kinase family protein [Actinomycetota bacterium]
MADFDVLVLADVNPDLVMVGKEAAFSFGETERRAEEAHLLLGGSGAIFACGAARLGLRVALCGVVGDDPFGAFVLDRLRANGVDVGACRVADGRSTGISVIVSRGRDRAILTAPGTIADLRADDVDRDLLRASRHVHAAAYFLQTSLQPGLPGLFEEARAAGVSSSLDPNWDPAETWDDGVRAAAASSDVFFCNGAEAAALAGEPDVEQAALRLAGLGRQVVVKVGGDGAIAARDGTLTRARARPVDVVDTVGAGDSFDAGFIAGLLAGWPTERTLDLAIACGTLTTRAIGGTAAQPSLVEALEFAGRN